MKIIIKDCFGKNVQTYENEGNRGRALRVAQKIVVKLLIENGKEDNIYTMRWRRTLNGYNIYDNFGSGLCFKIRIKK